MDGEGRTASGTVTESQVWNSLGVTVAEQTAPLASLFYQGFTIFFILVIASQTKLAIACVYISLCALPPLL